MKQKGYLPHPVIKAFVFWTLTTCLAAATLSGILMEWGTMGVEVASRCLWTAFLLAVGSVAFLIVNYLFGDLGQWLSGPEEAPPSVDPKFSERLRSAKEAVPGRERESGVETDHKAT